MWTAIPVALLCMIVNLSEGRQGSGPEGVKVLLNTGGLLFALPERQDSKSERANLRPVRPDLRP